MSWVPPSNLPGNVHSKLKSFTHSIYAKLKSGYDSRTLVEFSFKKSDVPMALTVLAECNVPFSYSPPVDTVSPAFVHVDYRLS